MSGEFVISLVLSFLGSVSPQQKFEVTDESVLQLSFIWQAKENTTQKMWREEKPNFGSYFYVCSPPPEPGLCKLG